MDMKRRDFNKLMLAAAAGIIAGCESETTATSGGETQVAVAEKHVCKGQNECKSQGGCKTGDNGCAGKNSCKGNGGCQVPVNPEHMS